MGHDVVAFGEALLRLQAEEDGRIEDAVRFFAFPGGAELNTCFALASLGLHTAWFSVVPEGPLGRRVVRHLRSAGVDASLVKTAPGRLGTYWVEYGRSPRTIEVHYDRKDSTVCSVRREDAPWEAVRSCRLFFVSGITLALSPACRDLALEMAEVAHGAGAVVATDLNFRARLWAAEEAAPVLERLARAADVVISAEDDLRRLYSFTGTEEDVAWAALERFSNRTVVLTRGAEGGLCVAQDEMRHCAVFPSLATDRIGAGDAFTAGFLYATLAGRPDDALSYGLAMAALKHSLPGDTLVTTREEVERVVSRVPQGIRR